MLVYTTRQLTERKKPNEIKFCVVMYWTVCRSCELVETFRTCSKCRESLCIICELDGKHNCEVVV